MPPPRFRLRTLMLVVAGIALLMGGGMEWWNYLDDIHGPRMPTFGSDFFRDAISAFVTLVPVRARDLAEERLLSLTSPWSITPVETA